MSKNILWMKKKEREREVFCKPEGDGPHGQHGTVKGSAVSLKKNNELQVQQQSSLATL